mgnify:CR=1 FL=1
MDNPYRPVQGSDIRCTRCGYDLSGSQVGGSCPECGTRVSESLRPRGTGQQNAPNSVACLVCGILSLTVCGLLGPIAIALYYSAKGHYDGGGYSASSMSMAKAGLITGIIATVLLVLVCGFGGLSVLLEA